MADEQETGKEKGGEDQSAGTESQNPGNPKHVSTPPHCPPKRYWQVPTPDRLIELCFTAVIVYFTASMVGIANKQWDAMNAQTDKMIESNRINREALIASTRAWLTPSRATIDSPIETSALLRLNVAFGNVGKDPALGFVAQEDIGFVDAPKPDMSWYTVFPPNTITDICAKTTASDGSITVYPSGLEHFYGVTFIKVDRNEMMKGTKILFIHGCFAYKTPVTKNIIHKSEYCFLLVPGIDEKTRRRVFKSQSCVYGNHAT